MENAAARCARLEVVVLLGAIASPSGCMQCMRRPLLNERQHVVGPKPSPQNATTHIQFVDVVLRKVTLGLVNKDSSNCRAIRLPF